MKVYHEKKIHLITNFLITHDLYLILLKAGADEIMNIKDLMKSVKIVS